jgi:hypothetical protein
MEKNHEKFILDKAYEECIACGYSKKERKVFISNIKEELKKSRTKRRLEKKLFERKREDW